MADELNRVQAYVRRLASRERSLLLTSLALRTLAVGAVGVGAAAVAVSMDVDRATAGASVVLVMGVLLLVGVGQPLVRRWRQSGDLGRQARLVEKAAPELRGRLVTAVERPDGPRGAESPLMLALVARKAAAVTDRVEAATIHPARWALRQAGMTTLLCLLAVVLITMAPGGGAGVAAWWVGAPVARAEADVPTLEESTKAAKMGDLTLRYIYPPYTGLEPYEVVNSTGEAHAPPGTRVEVVARSAMPVETAALVAYDEAPFEAVVFEGRQITGGFVVRDVEGTYQMVTSAGGEVATSEAFPIVPEPDLAPEVTVSAANLRGDTIEVAINGRIALDWVAKDDYGIERVMLEIDRKERKPDLFRSRERKAEVMKRLDLRPLDLAMEEGKTYELTVAAWDNDTVSGSKAGRSQVIEVVVLGEEGGRTLGPEEVDELIDLMVDALADHLEEPYPPGVSSGDIARWGEQVNSRWEPITSFVEDNLGARALRMIKWAPLADTLKAGRALVRFTQVSFTPGDRSKANGQSMTLVAGLRDEAIVKLEATILHLDAMRAKEALKAVAQGTNEMVEEADMLRQSLKSDTLDPQGLAISADVLSEYLESLHNDGERLSAGGLKDLVTSRTTEAEAMLEELRQSMSGGDMEDARKMAERLARQLDDLANDIRADMERRREQAKQQGDKAKDLIKELERIADDQSALAGAVQEIRDKEGAPQREKIRNLWKTIDGKVERLEEELGDYSTALETFKREFNEREYVRSAAEFADALSTSVAVRDVSEATDDAVNLLQHWRRYDGNFEYYARRGLNGGPGRGQVAEMSTKMNEVIELLEQLRRIDASGGAEAQGQIRSKSPEQGTLQEDLTSAARDAKRLMQMMPVQPYGMEESLEDGQARMGQAGKQLGQGRGMQAQGAQRAAEKHVRDAIEALKDAMSQSASQGGGGGESGGEPGGDEQGGPGEQQGDSPGGDQEDGDMASGDFELPEPEEFRTPEEYRQALLEGMAGDVPDEYRALKKRYYEELVHQ